MHRSGYWAAYDRERRARDPDYAEQRRRRSRAWKDRNRAYNRLRDRERARARRAIGTVSTSPFYLRRDD